MQKWHILRFKKWNRKIRKLNFFVFLFLFYPYPWYDLLGNTQKCCCSVAPKYTQPEQSIKRPKGQQSWAVCSTIILCSLKARWWQTLIFLVSCASFWVALTNIYHLSKFNMCNLNHFLQTNTLLGRIHLHDFCPTTNLREVL